MRRGLFFSFLALAIFIATSTGASARKNLSSSSHVDRAQKKAMTFGSAASLGAGSYRSPGRLRKIIVNASDAEAVDRTIRAGAVEIADYGSYSLFVIEQPSLPDLDRSISASAVSGAGETNNSPLVVRDDFNLLLLRSGEIDTIAEDAIGGFVGLGRATESGPRAARSLGWNAAASEPGAALRIVQFIGPVKDEWLDGLRASGMEPIAYVPNNAYLVRSSAVARDRLRASSASAGAASFIQWEGPFKDEYKLHPELKQASIERPDEQITVAIQVARAGGGDPRRDRDIITARRMASSLIGDAYEVLNFINLKMRIEASKVAHLASLEGVVNVEPWSPPELFDERAGQIVASNLSNDSKGASGPGYLAWLTNRGLATPTSFAIDVTDTGIDRGEITADKLHPDFLDSAGRSRVVYARDYTSELDPGDVPGHGTINLSIAGGSSTTGDKDMRDAQGFNHGLGIAPFVKLGSSKIFQSNGRFDLIEPFTKLISEAYRDGARISSNSWGDVANVYTIESQEYDARVRDALPQEPGNQEISILFAAGNAGFPRSVGSPSTAKNVISVGASEGARGGSDGCAVEDEDADNAQDIAFFSSKGPLDDGRMKPDLAAPGTHIQGAASQHAEFNGLLVCGEDLDKPYFPAGQTLYTWSSGTSHATPQVAGAAALARQFFLGRGQEPSAALIKALLVNTTSYMTGVGAGGNLPHTAQGWGLLNMSRAFDSAPKVFVNQSHTFGQSGQEFVITGEVKDSSRPFRVTLAWSDAPGLSALAPWVNDLDLEVAINGQVYRGNNFKAQESQPGGNPNTKDNVESVWLSPGTVGTFVIRVRATNIAGDGVPSNLDFTDQDFALVAYNAEQKDAPVAAISGLTLTGGADAVADPGETVSMRISLTDLSPIALAGGRGTLTSASAGVTVTGGASDFPTIAPGQTGESATAFTFTIDRTVACGSVIQFVLDIDSQGMLSRVPFTVSLGNASPFEAFSDDIESGESKWTHESASKKKKKKKPVGPDTWRISSKRFRSGGSAWFSTDPGQLADSHLDSIPVQLPSDGRGLQLFFYHTFEFERGRFDGGVLEISVDGGDFEDLGTKIIEGGYNGVINEFVRSNVLAGKPAWIEGRFGEFGRVVVDLTSYAGKSVVIRFRLSTDQDGRGLGWFIDDVSIAGARVACASN
jgi:hypothetical protein